MDFQALLFLFVTGVLFFGAGYGYGRHAGRWEGDRRIITILEDQIRELKKTRTQ